LWRGRSRQAARCRTEEIDMAKGGARPRSGPAKDPNSARTEKSGGIKVTALPSEGHRGRPPAFPLPRINRPEYTEKSQAQTKAFRARELAIWREVWKTPQAAAWSLDSWRWPTIAEFCRIKAAVELDPDSNAALLSRLREYRNEIGLSPDGLRANGWAIATNEVAAKAEQKRTGTPTESKQPTRRLRSVSK